MFDKVFLFQLCFLKTCSADTNNVALFGKELTLEPLPNDKILD